MSRPTRVWAAYGVCAAALFVLGAWTKARLPQSMSALEGERAQLQEVRALLENMPRKVAPTETASRPEAGMSRYIGGAVQRAAVASRMRTEAIEGLSGVDAHGEGGSPPRAYRVRLRSVSVESLVRFIYALETGEGIGAVRMEMSREGRFPAGWTVLLVVEDIP